MTEKVAKKMTYRTCLTRINGVALLGALLAAGCPDPYYPPPGLIDAAVPVHKDCETCTELPSALAIGVTVSPRVIRAGQSYELTLSLPYTGYLETKVQLCRLGFRPAPGAGVINHPSCAEETSRPDVRFIGGKASVTTGADETPGRYIFRFRIPLEPWSDRVDLAVADQSATDETMRVMTKQVFSQLDQDFPLEDQLALDPNADSNNTIAKVEKKYTTVSREDLAQRRAELFVGKSPAAAPPTNAQNVPAWRESWAAWRQANGERHLMLAEYYFLRELTGKASVPNREKISYHSALALTQLDMLAALPGHAKPLGYYSDPTGLCFTLGDTAASQSYLASLGRDTLKSLAWIKRFGFLPKTFCSHHERDTTGGPNDHDAYGFPCRTLDLHDRLSRVASAVTVSIFSKWVVKGTDQRRTEYGDDEEFWKQLLLNAPYQLAPNVKSAYTDLSGRSYDLKTAEARALTMTPSFYAEQMAGLAVAATIALEAATKPEDQTLCQEAQSWGIATVAYELAHGLQNPHGVTVKGPLNQDCDGTEGTITVGGQSVPDCEGGSRELFMLWEGAYPGMPLLLGDPWQRLGAALAAQGWKDLPADYTKTKLHHQLALLSTLWKDGEPYLDFTTALFDGAALAKRWPNRLCECKDAGESCTFFRKTIGEDPVVVHRRWEYGHDFALSAFSIHFQLMKLLGDEEAALEALEYNRLVYAAMLAALPDPRATDCGKEAGFAGGTTPAGQVLRWGGFLLRTAYGAWHRIPVASSTTP